MMMQKHPILPLLVLFFLLIFQIDASLAGNASCFLDLKPGQVVPVKITLANKKNETERVRVKIVDYLFNADGENFYLDPGTAEKSNAKWIDLKNKFVKIPPNSSAEIFYRIRVPNNRALKGTYWSLLLIEPEGFLPQPNDLDEKGMKIHVKVRYGYPIVTTIGEGKKELHIYDHKIEKVQEDETLAIYVENIGEVYLKPELTLKLFDQNGKAVSSLHTPYQTLYPGTSTKFHVPLKELPRGDYKGFILLNHKNQDAFYSKCEFTLK